MHRNEPNKDELASLRSNMVDQQLRSRGITSERVLRAMATIPREWFLPANLACHAYDDRALAVGLGQTISQPFIVAYMTAALRLEPHHRVLEIGTGTGYQTAILAQLATRVYSIERLPELHEQSKRTLTAHGVTNVSLFLGDGTLGLPDHAPFDRIIVTAGAPSAPRRLIEQLTDDGLLVAPIDVHPLVGFASILFIAIGAGASGAPIGVACGWGCAPWASPSPEPGCFGDILPSGLITNSMPSSSRLRPAWAIYNIVSSFPYKWTTASRTARGRGAVSPMNSL